MTDHCLEESRGLSGETPQGLPACPPPSAECLERSRGGLSLNHLKAVAVAAMVIDHIAFAFVPDGTLLAILLHSIGKITGPTMFFAAVEGCHHTRNLNRYLLRLAVFALVSWFPFLYFHFGGDLAAIQLMRPNVIYTIFLGVLAVRIRRSPRLCSAWKVLLILLLFILSVPADWGYTGVVIILVFDYYYGSWKHQAFAYCMVVMLDMGVLSLLKKHAPGVKAHISTQASVSNYQAAAAWYELGASRVILARELSLEEIRTIRDKTPADLEIEAFVHGAMCVSYSGRCLLSNYMTGRDSSRGACAQPCRYQYALVEEKRPGEYFPVFEDEQGTYILNSRDMCMIDHLGDLCGAGLSSLKIEGRAKSAYYAAIVTGAYRHCLDAAAAGESVDPVWRDEVEHVSHRPYSTGFYYGPPGQYYATSRYVREWQVAAVVTDCDSAGHAVLSLRNKFRAGDTVEIVGPDLRPFSITVPEMRDEAGASLVEPRTPQMKFYMDLPKAVPPYSLVRRGVDLSAK